MRSKKQLFIGPAAILAAGAAGLTRFSSASATAPVPTPGQLKTATAVAGRIMDKPGKVHVMVGKGKDVFDALYPNETVLGAYQSQIAGDDVVVEEATSGFVDPTGFETGNYQPGLAAAHPVTAVVTINDVTTGKSLGFMALTGPGQLTEIHAKENTLRGKGAVETDVDVAQSDIAAAHAG